MEFPTGGIVREPCYVADLVKLDQDIFHIPEEQMLDTHVTLTMVGGKVVYQK